MGLPPSGGFNAKWLMLQASIASGQWLWTLPILAGSLLAAGYVYRILTPALGDGEVSYRFHLLPRSEVSGAGPGRPVVWD